MSKTLEVKTRGAGNRPAAGNAPRFESVIARLRETRRAHEISQEDLARLVGASWPSVSRWERGKAKPEEDTLVRMERLLLLEQKIQPALKPGAFKRFLFTPHPLLDNFAPVDLLQSGYSFQRLLALVEGMLGGDMA
jgi:transcriptional regulator with XRE-family HTH domain